AGGFTVAVLGNPIGDVYPPENRRAFETLYARGLVLSEMYPGCPRTRADFPNRNRIISGLCDSTVIAEAGEHSGALITAKYALSQGRGLYAVPGDIGAENAGTNMLIKKGVPAATEPYDVIAPLSLEYPDKIKPYEPSLTAGLRSYGNAPAEKPAQTRAAAHTAAPRREPPPPEEIPEPEKPQKLSGAPGERILNALRAAQRPLSPDEIARATGLGASAVLAELTLLEIDGSAVSSAGNRYTATGE
ncbi:MAG: DNA-processing protein DprA, partial [Clostridia bacterium]|nr:DNA-processing protein DprA [Clostridia bacterium]